MLGIILIVVVSTVAIGVQCYALAVLDPHKPGRVAAAIALSAALAFAVLVVAWLAWRLG